jgi:Asp-tRNA(Asn)/Glu-tRNA(Gln) amidotransferase A subunit family amidase
MALSWTMDKIGPMCRSVEDCALVFSAIYGPDGYDLTVADKPFAWNPALNPRTLRVGYVKSSFEAIEQGESDTDSVLESHLKLERINQINSNASLDVMREQGFDLIPISLPEANYESLFMILTAEAAASFDAMTRADEDDLLTWQEDQAFPNMFRAARFITAVEYIQANRIRMKLMQEMAQIMREVDVFIVPSFGGNVLTLTNLTGHPAVVLPNGFTDRHTPTSITFVGGLYKEAQALAVAKAYQDATDFHKQCPPMDYEGIER